ncbi:DUF5134 domain-containing protein [Peterkaempfera sp. SMS 1(5)a]|uniref:DUF5134 domain-containing protein n=1 Tax=Peterkaempfera podocarpi TaxID=3232308 RepID=UPI00366D878C
MHGAPVLGWLLAALTGAAGLYCLARLCAPAPAAGCTDGTARGAGGRESDAAEALMGLGMAVMALPPAHHGGLPPTAWAAVFAGAGAWFTAAALRRGGRGARAHRLHHAVDAGAMVYMVLLMAAPTGPAGQSGHDAMPGMAGMAGSAADPVPLLSGLLLLYFGGYALWTGTRLLRPAHAVAGRGGWTLLQMPGMSRACRLVMGLGMFSMLLAG